jgi:hypothetical protein
VRVERGLAAHIRRDSTQVSIRVSKVDDVNRAVEVLGSVRPYIHSLGVRFVSEAFPAPGGAMIWLDGKGVVLERLLTIPDRIARSFTDAGLREAVIGTAKGLTDTDPDYPREAAGCVSLTLLAAQPPPGEAVALPEPWTAAGRQWWLDRARGRRTWVSLVGTVLPVTMEVADQMLQAALSARSGGNALVAGTSQEGAASLSCKFSLAPAMTLKLGGVTDSELLATARFFVTLARDLSSEVVYGLVEFLPTFTPGRAHDHPVGRGLKDRVNVAHGGYYRDHVFDAFPFQVLSTGHLEHLTALPGAQPLADGRVGVQFGEFEQWLPGHDVSALQQHGRALLDPCLRWR